MSSQVVEFHCEDHNVDVDMVSVWIGHDEDGRDQFDIIHGVESSDSEHEGHDLSLGAW